MKRFTLAVLAVSAVLFNSGCATLFCNGDEGCKAGFRAAGYAMQAVGQGYSAAAASQAAYRPVYVAPAPVQTNCMALNTGVLTTVNCTSY